MAWYTDSSIYHYLKWGNEAEKVANLGGEGKASRSQNPTDQFPRPTQESEKNHGPFQQVLPRRAAPPKLTQAPGYEPVKSKKPMKNIAYALSKKKS
jgi:hypothetical protein